MTLKEWSKKNGYTIEEVKPVPGVRCEVRVRYKFNPNSYAFSWLDPPSYVEVTPEDVARYQKEASDGK